MLSAWTRQELKRQHGLKGNRTNRHANRHTLRISSKLQGTQSGAQPSIAGQGAAPDSKASTPSSPS